MASIDVRLVAVVHARVLHPATRHGVGLPTEPSEASKSSTLPAPDVLLLEQEGPGSVFLSRLTRAGEFGGDTWRATVKDAKRQAEFEYGSALGPWTEVPAHVTDARQFAIDM